ncbi:ABC transporter ATP-binding protein [Vagococcus entomophilus]|uniref:ATP-binding protein n=1 Tax=Vagococcus entomophilus TaxID=1160095 RepID=A0A430AH20_9ENTE|nr:ABC transporter ATP-binding protein [Vagococcus entomophilus]RSU07154.1 ATP-binding protein [Vagococcus entomophilus]
MFSLLKYAKKYRFQIILGPIFKFLEAVFELFLPIYMARLIDNGIKKGDAQYVIHTARTMIFMSLIGLICVLICQYFASVASQGFGTELRSALLKKINTLSHKELDELGTSTLVTRMTSDINQLQLALAMLIRLVIRAPFLSIGSVIMAFFIEPKLALIFVLILPIFCIVLYFMMKKTVPLYKKVQKKVDHLNQAIGESLAGVRVIRAFARKENEEEKIAHVTDDLAKAYRRVANISAILTPATTLILNIAILSLLYFGGIKVNIGSLKQGEVLALINYMMQMLLALIVVSNLVVIFTRASASASRVNEVLAIKPSIPEDTLSSYQSVKTLSGTLAFQQVDFRYQPDAGLALQKIDFSIKQGTIFGITGPTGSGKSTLIQLIPRFYDVSTGAISLAGQPITQLPVDELRQAIGLVPQKSVLFSGTIRENLQWGKADASDEECLAALKTAQCLEFVQSLPNGLDTRVLADGNNFSGGQKQRLAIARALIRKPPILILDDSLSALDYRTDQDLRHALKQDLANTTVIIVSQRISSVQNANQILVLNEGKQVGLGTHSELLTHSAIYQEIVASQEERKEQLNEK